MSDVRVSAGVTEALTAYVAPSDDNTGQTVDDLRVWKLAEELMDVARARLEATRESLLETCRQSRTPEPRILLDCSRDTTLREPALEYDIREAAREIGYRAKLDGHHTWIRFTVATDHFFSDLVISFHPFGRLLDGILDTSAILVEGAPRSGRLIKAKAASQRNFPFNCRQTLPELQPRFEQWLDAAIIRAFNEFERYRPAPAPIPTETPNA